MDNEIRRRHSSTKSCKGIIDEVIGISTVLNDHKLILETFNLKKKFKKKYWNTEMYILIAEYENDF